MTRRANVGPVAARRRARRAAVPILSPLAAVLAVAILAGPAPAKKFRYGAGPKAPTDTSLSVAEPEVVPIVRARGPRVPATNLQLMSLVANTAFERALAKAPIDTGTRITLAPISASPLNFVVEHAILRDLGPRRVTVTIRRTPMPEDSTLSQALGGADPVLEYQVATARVTYLRLVGWLPGRVRIERQALVEGRLVLRDPTSLRVLWTGDADYNLLDSFPRSQLPLVEDPNQPTLKGTVPQRNVDKLAEPIIVVAIVTGLVALFFQNRP